MPWRKSIGLRTAELKTMERIFADVNTTDEVIGMLDSIRA
jgi:hypothetical protein